MKKQLNCQNCGGECVNTFKEIETKSEIGLSIKTFIYKCKECGQEHIICPKCQGDKYQGIFDISLLASLPNIIISEPKDAVELNSLLRLSLETPHPFVVRYPKDNVIYKEEEKHLEIGKWQVEKELKDKNILSYGPVINIFKDEIENNNLEIGLINALFIKPMDFELLNKLNNTTLYIYEDVVSIGSLAMMIKDYIFTNNLNIKVESIALDVYPGSGTKDELLKVFQEFDPESTGTMAYEVLHRALVTYGERLSKEEADRFMHLFKLKPDEPVRYNVLLEEIVKI